MSMIPRPTRKYFHQYGWGLLALLFISCGFQDDTSPVDPDTKIEFQLRGTISGIVSDTAGNPLGGVSVTLDTAGYTTVSDTLGRYTIPDVPGGTWDVRFQKTFYRDTLAVGIVIAIDEERVGVDMTMRPAVGEDITDILDSLGSFAGRVLDTAGQGIRGVQVLLDSLGLTTVTDSLGNFLLPGVRAGVWSLSFSGTTVRDSSLHGLPLQRREQFTGLMVVLRPGAGTQPTPLTAQLVGDWQSAEISISATDAQGESLTVSGYDLSGAGLLSAGIAPSSDSVRIEIFVRVQGRLTGYSQRDWAGGSSLYAQGSVDATGLVPRMDFNAPDTLLVLQNAEVPLVWSVRDTGTNAGVATVVVTCEDYALSATDSGAVLVAPWKGVRPCELGAVDHDSNRVARAFYVRALELGDALDNAGLWVGRFEVTALEFAHVLNTAAQTLYASEGVLRGRGVPLLQLGFGDLTWNNGLLLMRNNQTSPITGVSWYGAALYCNLLSQLQGLSPIYDTTTWERIPGSNGWRLPTESEWQNAATGGSLTQGYTFAGGNELNAVAWHVGNTPIAIPYRPVGTKTPNELELYDMSGNVREWVEDWVIGNTTHKIHKGGGFEDDDLLGGERLLRPSSSGSLFPQTLAQSMGFRIVRTP